MITKEQIEKFYIDVEALGLKFPGARIAELTGYSKGNVSEYLNKKKDPSEHFLKTFYKHFGSSINVPRETVSNEPSPDYLQQRRDQKNGDRKSVPMYGGFTTLGNIEVYDDENIRHKVVAQLPPEVFPGCDYAEKAKGRTVSFLPSA